ncbi:hypothetical protein RUM44_009453 [Polyplax serrata]|uniref:Uncharacterized protein n=1 Tax=Polyplax serrata TaxID=468196 RepID=A0ABR1ATB7_POLSC
MDTILSSPAPGTESQVRDRPGPVGICRQIVVEVLYRNKKFRDEIQQEPKKERKLKKDQTKIGTAGEAFDAALFGKENTTKTLEEFFKTSVTLIRQIFHCNYQTTPQLTSFISRFSGLK